MENVYIIHKTVMSRGGDYEEDLLEYGIFKSYFKVLDTIRTISQEIKDEYKNPYEITEEFISNESGYDFDLITISPDYSDYDDVYEDYSDIVELYARPIKFIE